MITVWCYRALIVLSEMALSFSLCFVVLQLSIADADADTDSGGGVLLLCWSLE